MTPRPGFALALLGVLFAVGLPLAFFSFVWWGWTAVAMYVFSGLAALGCGLAVSALYRNGATAARIATVITLTLLGITAAVLGSAGAGIGIAYEPRVVLLLGAWALWVAATVTALTDRGGVR